MVENQKSDGRLNFVAHRGASERFPENTLVAYQAAIDAGAKFVELDVQLTADHVPILHHDQDLLRMTGAEGDITQMKSEDVLSRFASFRDKFGAKFADNPLVTLSDFSAVLSQHPDVTVFVEIKRQSVEVFGAGLTAKCVLDAMTLIRQHAVVISFNEDVLRSVQAISPTTPIGFVLRQYDAAHQDIARQLEPAYLFCKTTHLPPSRTVWSGPWRWVLYNTDTVDEALDFYESGFDMLETNRIVDLLQSPRFNTHE